MNQTIKDIRKSCQENVNQLGQTYRPMYEEIEKKLRRGVHAGEELESALLDFSSMLLEAEAAGLTTDEIFPDSLDRFYEELTEALPVITQEQRTKKKKRVAFGIVAVIVAVFLLVRGVEKMSLWSDSYVERQDHPYMYQSIMMATTSYVKGEHDYFFMRGKYLYRFDPDTQKVSALCTQEDCLHARQPDEFKYDICNANVVGDSITNLNVGYYDGYVYYIAYHNNGSYYSLNRVKEDGSEGEQVKRWGNERLDPWRWIIHRGYLYYLESAREMIEKEHVEHYYVKRIALENPEQDEVIFYEKLQDGLHCRAYSLQAYGNGIYILLGEALPGENYSSTTLYRYDLKTKALQTVSLPEENDGYHILSMTFLQDKLYLYAGNALDGTNTNDRYFHGQLDGSDMQLLPIEEDGFLHADETNLYVFGFQRTSAEDIVATLHVYDAWGESVDSMAFDADLWDFQQTSFGDEQGILLIDAVDERKVWDVYWIDKSEIGNWNGQTLELERVDRMHYGYAYTRYLTEKQEFQQEMQQSTGTQE